MVFMWNQRNFLNFTVFGVFLIPERQQTSKLLNREDKSKPKWCANSKAAVTNPLKDKIWDVIDSTDIFPSRCRFRRNMTDGWGSLSFRHRNHPGWNLRATSVSFQYTVPGVSLVRGLVFAVAGLRKPETHESFLIDREMHVRRGFLDLLPSFVGQGELFVWNVICRTTQFHCDCIILFHREQFWKLGGELS